MIFDPFEVTVEWVYWPPMTIFIRHDEVTHVTVILSQRISNCENFLSEGFPLEPSIACRSELSFYLAF
jgi:hypothetical protein